MIKKSIAKTILTIIVLDGFMLSSSLAGDVVVREPSPQELIIEFEPQQWQTSTETVNGQSYIRIGFDNGCYESTPGAPLIPERVLLIGIPFRAQVAATITAEEILKAIDGKLLPTPTFSPNGLSNWHFRENPTSYRSSQPVPEALLAVSPPMIIRDQQVVLLRIAPIRYWPVAEQIQLLRKIIIRLQFEAPAAQLLPPQRQQNISAIAPILLNSKQADVWRKFSPPPPRHRLKTSDTRTWYKIRVRDEDLYRLTGAQLKAAGVDLQEIKPYRLKIFNNGGSPLPESIGSPRPDRLIENPILVEDGGDGSFDANDYILFYGKAVNGWHMDAGAGSATHYLHPYSRENVYWLCWEDADSGKRIPTRLWPSVSDPTPVSDFYDHLFIESEYKNLLQSGRLWLGDYFSAQSSSRSYQFDLTGVMAHASAELVVQLAGVSQGTHRFSLLWNNQPLATVPPFSGIGSQYLTIQLHQFRSPILADLQDGYNRLTINYQPEADYSSAYLDWIELAFYRQLMLQHSPLLFYSPDSSGVYRYRLQIASAAEVQIFDISEISNIARLETHPAEGNFIEFVDSVTAVRPKKYLAVMPGFWKSPLKIEKDLPSELRDETNAARFIIITYDDFYDAAMALKSLRENCDTLLTRVVRVSDIYDEFSWGVTDITAIRDFIKYAFDHWQVRPRYVLLLGDGDFDYKNIVSSHQPNWLPVYQTGELSQLSSRPRDDWFVCVAGDDDLPDLAIGRIPAQNPDQAMAAVNKIIQYENSPLRGKWLQTIAMVGDDEFGEGGEYDGLHHIPDVENFAENLIPAVYDIQKIYLTEFSSVRDAAISGIRKPAAHAALLEQINQGCLMVDFVGHGNERVWTHERILQAPEDLAHINNGPKQAFWIAATCNFGRFDHPEGQSFAEELVIAPNRGAIAVLSSARLANPFENVAFNRSVLRQIFADFARPVRLGDVVWLAKLSTGNSPNDQQYHLLGDPTLRLALPGCSVEITSLTPDSFRALSRLELQGKILATEQMANEAPGEALVEAFDSRKERRYVVRPGLEYRYQLPGTVIYRGAVTVTNNSFRCRFIVPKDISYGGRDGRVSIFYRNDQIFGVGCQQPIPVSGTEQQFHDTVGPNITIGFEGQHFMTTGFVPPDPILLVTIADSGSGINIAGDIGHQIVLTLDHASDQFIILNRYFQYEKDSYQIGQIIYPLGRLAEGDHFLQIKAWDNFNNSAQQETQFTVVALDRLMLREVMNFPNPFAETTAFTFWVSQSCDVKISIFTVTGRLIRTLGHLKAETGFNHFTWDGRDEEGDALANGIYLYRIDARCGTGSQTIRTSCIEKCAIIR